MKKPIQLTNKLSLLILLFLTACIETEIVPEILEPVLSLSQKNLSLKIGETGQLQATYTDESNIDRSDLITWRSNNANIASVSNSGVVAAKALGQTWIVATVPGRLADSTLVTVVPDANAIATVEINVPENAVQVGATFQCTARTLNSEGSLINNQTITWQSSNTSVLSIDANGLATALSPGTTQVTAKAAGISSVPVVVEVLSAASSARTGSFQGNMSYNVRGTATLGSTNGKLALSFSSDFQSNNGPGLRVYLAKIAPGVLTSQNSVKLGNLKNTSGAQTYDVPDSVKIDDFDFAVIYCEPFNIAFGFARLN